MAVPFTEKLRSENKRLSRGSLEVLQVNLGKLCNLTCSHCHVEAGPGKILENADGSVADAVVEALSVLRPSTLDITGGAPEMNPHFKRLVIAAREKGINVIDRCNLTIFFEKGFEGIPEFLAQHEVCVVASLPCYSRDNVERQRGKGVFDPSIAALKKLNSLGYGKIESGLELNLVYNPVNAVLPPGQEALESDYKKKLMEDYGIFFNHLYTITNMPITRYKKFLQATKTYEPYLELLEKKFNANTLDHLMCSNTLSVGWDGALYDCDFNQALGIPLANQKGWNIKNITRNHWERLSIAVGDHCYGCTAGSGSGCQGSLQ